MIFKLILPIIAGFSIVLQGTLNRTSATQIGLVSAVFLNALVFLIFSGAFWLAIRFELVGGLSTMSAKTFMDLKWWQILPGVLGFLIVLLTPLSIEFLGANLTFAVIICTQLFVSMLWDSYMEKVSPSPLSLLGVGVMVVGLILIVAAKSR